MPSEMSLDEDFAVWLGKQPLEAKKEILARLGLLRERGPNLGRPYADTVKSSAYSNMKELRIQIAGEPWRVLFAFDPKRTARILLGGNKASDKRWYDIHIPIADERYRRHLDGLKP